MERERWQRVEELFAELMTTALPERSAFIMRACRNDEELRAELQSLLSAHEAADGPLDTVRPGADALPVFEQLPAGTRLGAWSIVRIIGRGGAGEVYETARADGAFEQRAALKLLQRQAVSELERFHSERRILARLEHPGIARLLDGGVHTDGRPYMVVEFVEGHSLLEHCERAGLPLRERLALFVQVCGIVTYAHRNLVVHRDLKPGNILVGSDGRVRLVDFGIAKLLEVAAGPGREEHTVAPLTPDYAAPEQLTGQPITTGTDVYALGVVLFELLTGQRPWRSGGLPLAQAVRVLITEEAPLPSKTVQRSGRGVASAHALSGDLDAIVTQCLFKEPLRRYESVAALEQDVQRYLHGEPVTARRAGRGYRFLKFLLRHRLAVFASAGALIAIIAGAGIALWQASVARTQLRSAQAEEAFLEGVFRANSNDQPDPARARNTTARELLRIGAEKVDRALADAPAARLRALGTLVRMHGDLELWDEAVVLGRKRVALARKLYGASDVRVVDALVELSLSMSGSSANSEREPVLREALAILDRNGEKTTQRRGVVLGEMAQFYADQDLKKALSFGDQSIGILRAFAPSADLIEALALQGWIYSELARDVEGEAPLAEAVALSRSVQGPKNAHLPRLLAYLGQTQYRQQKFAAAESNLRAGWQLARQLKGELDPSSWQLEMRLGLLLAATARLQEALDRIGHALAMAQQSRAADDSLYVPMVQEMFGRVLTQAGRIEEGQDNLARAAAVWQKSRSGSTYLIGPFEEQADAQVQLGNLALADTLLGQSRKLRELTGDHTSNINGDVFARVALLLAAKRPEEAEQALAAAQVPANGANPDSLARMRLALVRSDVELALGRNEEALRLSDEIRASVAASAQRAYLKAVEAGALLNKGLALHMLGRPGDAEAPLRTAVQLNQQVYATFASPVLARSQTALAACLLDMHRASEAAALAVQAQAILGAHRVISAQFIVPLRAVQARLHLGTFKTPAVGERLSGNLGL